LGDRIVDKHDVGRGHGQVSEEDVERKIEDEHVRIVSDREVKESVQNRTREDR
jgi:hypothetical protein